MHTRKVGSLALLLALACGLLLSSAAFAETAVTDDQNFQGTYEIRNAEKIGIGTATPGALLDVRGAAIFNEAGADADFRIEGDTNANLFFLDAGTDRIGIGTNTPSVMLHNTGDFITNGPYVDVRSYASFSAAISAIGATARTLLIPNQQNVTANVTVPSNVTLWFLQGGSLNISTGVTVTINGHISAELYQIFTWAGTGNVSLGISSVPRAYPQWWGAKGDCNNDDTSAIQAAINSMSFGGKVYFPAGRYITTNSIRITHSALWLEGAGPGEANGGATINAQTSGKPAVAFLGVNNFGMNDLEIRTDDWNNANVLLVIGRDSAGTTGGQQSCFRNVALTGYPTTAFLYSVASEQATYYNLYIKENGSGAAGCTTRGIVGTATDVLNIGSTFSPTVTIGSSSDTTNFFYGTTLNMHSTNANSVGIALYGDDTGSQTLNWAFYGISGGAGAGSKAHVYIWFPSTNTDHEIRNITIMDARMEGAAQSSIYIDGGAYASKAWVRGLRIENYFAPDTATGAGIYCNAILHSSKIDADVGSSNNYSFNEVIDSDIYLKAKSATFNSAVSCSRLYVGYGVTANLNSGVNNRGNMMFDYNASAQPQFSAAGGLRVKHNSGGWSDSLKLEVCNSTNRFDLINDGSLFFGYNGSGILQLLSSGKLVSYIATGTPPFGVTSTTPVAHLTTVPATYNASGTQQTEAHIVRDSTTLSSGSVTVSLSGSAAFTSSSTYTVTALQNSASTATEYYTVEYVSGSSFKIRSSNSSSTATVRYMAVGN